MNITPFEVWIAIFFCDPILLILLMLLLLPKNRSSSR